MNMLATLAHFKNHFRWEKSVATKKMVCYIPNAFFTKPLIKMWCNNWLLTSLLQVSSNAQARSRMGNAAIVVTLVTFLASNINAQDNLNDTYQDDQCSIGNVQFLLTSWQFCPLDGVLMIASTDEFYFLKNHENSWNFVYIHTPEHLFTFVNWFNFLHLSAVCLQFQLFVYNFSYLSTFVSCLFTFFVNNFSYLFTIWIFAPNWVFSFWQDFSQKNTKVHLTPSSGNFRY